MTPCYVDCGMCGGTGAGGPDDTSLCGGCAGTGHVIVCSECLTPSPEVTPIHPVCDLCLQRWEVDDPRDERADQDFGAPF